MEASELVAGKIVISNTLADTKIWVLATFGDDEKLRALRQKAEGRRQKKKRKEEVVNLSFKFV